MAFWEDVDWDYVPVGKNGLNLPFWCHQKRRPDIIDVSAVKVPLKREWKVLPPTRHEMLARQEERARKKLNSRPRGR